MDTMREPGAGIGRQIATGERADIELARFISKRHERRVKDEDERAIEDLWREAERRQEAARRAEYLAGWHGWHRSRADLYARLSAEHEAAAARLMGGAA